MKRAIVLGGGGSRGSYECGFWKALIELGIDYDLVVGTSIGSINAGLMAQGDYALSEHLWATITAQQVMKDGINLYPDVERFLEQGKDLSAFLKLYAKNRGADISPLIALIRESVDEDAVRRSRVKMGLVTVRFSDLTPVQVMIDEIPQGRLIDYMIASASCFPAFPIQHIGEESFIDGGYFDNTPVNFALTQGAEEIICVDLMPKPTHPTMIAKPWMTYIHGSQPLGTILLFERETLDRNRTLGYRDTMRAFGHLRGIHYCFDAADIRARTGEALDFSRAVARFEAGLAYRYAIAGKISVVPLTELMQRETALLKNRDAADEMLVAAEICAAKFGVSPDPIYTLDSLNEAIVATLPLEAAKGAIKDVTNLEWRNLITLLTGLDRKLLIACLALLMDRKLIGGGMTRVLTYFSEELLAAFYLHEFHPAVKAARGTAEEGA